MQTEAGIETSPMLQVKDLDAYYGPIQALHGVCLDVGAGEIVAVIGANGVGKTTLLRTLSGVAPPRAGEVRFEGRPIAGLRPEQIVRLGISHVPERRELFASMTVLENLELGAYHRGRDAKASLQRDLEKVWGVFPILRARRKQVAGTLSGGEQQMLAIARGLMSKPKLLLLDEPSLGLAPLLVREVLRIVGQLREMGRTVLLVEQNAHGALEVADRAYLMEVGRIVMKGTPAELLGEERIRRAYMGRRIAPLRRPHKIKLQPDQKPIRKRRINRLRRDIAEEEHPMKTKTLATSVHSYTLPDEYFEGRLSLTADELETIQDEALPEAFAYAFDNSETYHAKFSAAGLTPDSVRGLQDLRRLPFTTVEDILPEPAQGRTALQVAAVDQRRASLIHTSSGTTGSPKIFPYTGRDVAQWAANVATVMWINGLRKSDTMLEIIPFGQFTGGGGIYLGGIALGLTLIPLSIGPGLTEKVIAHFTGRIRVGEHEVPIDPLLRANSMLSLSSFVPRLLEMLDEYDLGPEELSLTKIVCGAEPSSDAVRMRIAERCGIWLRDHYGLGEFYGPGQGGECDSGGGLHILSDTYIAEVIDPETGEPTPEGEMGELVMTSLHKVAFPLFRYRTGDRVMALPQNCPCGIEHKWVGRVPGRICADDIMLPGGVVVNRTYLEETLLQVDGAGAEYAVTVAEHPTRKGLQRFYIAIEGDPASGLAEMIVSRMRVEYNNSPVVHVLPTGAIPRPPGKAKRIYTPEEYRALVE